MQIHEGGVECDVCQRVFATEQDMQEHRLIHGGPRDFVCQHCGKAFTTNGQLQLHIRAMHVSR
jgi:hypothetical protein